MDVHLSLLEKKLTKTESVLSNKSLLVGCAHSEDIGFVYKYRSFKKVLTPINHQN